MNKRTVDAAKYSSFSGALGGSLVVILAWILSIRGILMPAEVIAALTVIFSFATNIILVRTGIISDSE